MSPQERLTPLPSDSQIQIRQLRFTRARRLTGFWLGMFMGLGYFTCSQLINSLYLPDIPIYQVPPGMPWLALIGGVFCALTGLLTAWSDSPIVGILWGSFLGTLVFDSYALVNTIQDQIPLTWVVGILMLILLPMAAMTATVVGVFRWALDRQQAAWQDQRTLLLTVGIPVLLVIAAVSLGATALYPQTGRDILVRMNQLVLAGQSASSDQALPKELAVDNVKNFKANAVGAYTLEWSKDPTNRYAIPRGANTGGKESIAVARFAPNYLLICLYPNSQATPECVSRGTAR